MLMRNYLEVGTLMMHFLERSWSGLVFRGRGGRLCVHAQRPGGRHCRAFADRSHAELFRCMLLCGDEKDTLLRYVWGTEPRITTFVTAGRRRMGRDPACRLCWGTFTLIRSRDHLPKWQTRQNIKKLFPKCLKRGWTR